MKTITNIIRSEKLPSGRVHGRRHAMGINGERVTPYFQTFEKAIKYYASTGAR
jgi:hypothetical protein